MKDFTPSYYFFNLGSCKKISRSEAFSYFSIRRIFPRSRHKQWWGKYWAASKLYSPI